MAIDWRMLFELESIYFINKILESFQNSSNRIIILKFLYYKDKKSNIMFKSSKFIL